MKKKFTIIIQKYRSLIIADIVLVFLVILLSGLLKNMLSSVKISSTGCKSAAWLSAEILEGEYYGQSFIASENNLSGFSIFFHPYGRINSANLIINLIDTQTEEIVFSIEENTIKFENDYRSYKFEALRNSKGRKYEIVIIGGENATTGNSVAMFITSEDIYKEGELFTKDTTTEQDICFEVFYEAENNSVITFLILIFILIILILSYLNKDRLLHCTDWILKNVFTNFVWSVNDEHKAKMANMVCVLSLIYGSMVILISPPYAQPDEWFHYYRACNIGHGNFFNLPGNNLTVSETKVFDSSLASYDGIMGFNDLNNNIAVEAPLNGSFLNHIIAGIGIFIIGGICGGFNPYTAMIIGKIANLLFYSLVIRKAIKRTGAFVNTMCLLALMPMALYQGASLSYDALIIPCSMLLFAYSTKIITSHSDYIITKGDIIGVIFSCFFLAGVKSAAYLPLIVVLLALSIRKFGSLKRYLFCITLVIITIFLSYGVPIIIENIFWPDRILSSGIGSFLVERFSEIPILLKTTIERDWKWYVETFIGNLGAFYVRFPDFFYQLWVLIILGSVFIDGCMASKINIRFRLLSVFGALISATGIFVATYVGWTGGVGDYVTGIQGRYFIPLMLFAVSAFLNPLLSRIKNSEKLYLYHSNVIKIFSLISLNYMIFFMFTRYWMN